LLFFYKIKSCVLKFYYMKHLKNLAIIGLIAIPSSSIFAKDSQPKNESFQVTDMHENGNYKGRQSNGSSLEIKCGWQKWHRCWTISNGWIDFGDDHLDPIQVGNPTVEQGPGGIDEEGYEYDSFIVTPN